MRSAKLGPAVVEPPREFPSGMGMRNRLPSALYACCYVQQSTLFEKAGH